MFENLIVACTVGFGVGFGLILAVFLAKKTRLNGLLQSVAFSPYIVSLASIALLWMWLMNNDFGFLNALLAVFGIPAIDWLGSPDVSYHYQCLEKRRI